MAVPVAVAVAVAQPEAVQWQEHSAAVAAAAVPSVVTLVIVEKGQCKQFTSRLMVFGSTSVRRSCF